MKFHGNAPILKQTYCAITKNKKISISLVILAIAALILVYYSDFIECDLSGCTSLYDKNYVCISGDSNLIKKSKFTTLDLKFNINKSAEPCVLLAVLSCELDRSDCVDRVLSIGYLIDAGAEVNIKTDSGDHIIFSIINRLRHDRSLMTIAIKEMSARGLDVNVKNEYGHTPLMSVSSIRNLSGPIEAIIDAGADVNASNIRGTTALMLSSWYSDFSSVITLLDAGASPNAIDQGLGSALHYAVSNDDEYSARKNTEILLKRGANPNSRGVRGATPLSWAAAIAGSNGNFSPENLLDLLLEYGADPTIRDYKGRSVLDYARGNDAMDYESFSKKIKKAIEERAKKSQQFEK